MTSNRFSGEWRNSNGFERFLESKDKGIKGVSDQIVGLLAVHQFVPMMEQLLEGCGREILRYRVVSRISSFIHSEMVSKDTSYFLSFTPLQSKPHIYLATKLLTIRVVGN